jgi:hypothetical protein
MGQRRDLHSQFVQLALLFCLIGTFIGMAGGCAPQFIPIGGGYGGYPVIGGGGAAAQQQQQQQSSNNNNNNNNNNLNNIVFNFTTG